MERFKELQHRDIDYLVELASRNLRDGIIAEPRVFFDVLTLDQPVDVEVPGTPDVFINGEQFPITITHLSAALRFDAQHDDERLVQAVGGRLTFHDQYYQSRDFVPLPLWANKPVAASDSVTQGMAAWTFDRPNILSSRDSLQVTVALEAIPASARTITVAFTGVGLQSKRPYLFQQSIQRTDLTQIIMPTDGFRNDGAEPVALTDMTVQVSAEANDVIGVGDIRQVRLSVRQVGNGTQSDWFVGPTVPPLSTCPATVVGYTSGRALVHRFPKSLLWEPGEGITLDLVSLNAASADVEVVITLMGYIAVV